MFGEIDDPVGEVQYIILLQIWTTSALLLSAQKIENAGSMTKSNSHVT